MKNKQAASRNAERVRSEAHNSNQPMVMSGDLKNGNRQMRRATAKAMRRLDK